RDAACEPPRPPPGAPGRLAILAQPLDEVRTATVAGRTTPRRGRAGTGRAGTGRRGAPRPGWRAPCADGRAASRSRTTLVRDVRHPRGASTDAARAAHPLRPRGRSVAAR